MQDPTQQGTDDAPSLGREGTGQDRNQEESAEEESGNGMRCNKRAHGETQSFQGVATVARKITILLTSCLCDGVGLDVRDEGFAFTFEAPSFHGECGGAE